MSGTRVHLSLFFSMVASLSMSCGSSSHNRTLSPAQAQAISQQVVHAAVQSLSGIEGLNSGCTPTPNGQNCNFPLSANHPCSGSGAIVVAGDVQGMLNNSGAGSLGAQLTIMPNDCTVSNITFYGSPDITIAGSINFSSTGPTLPVSLTEDGEISYGPNPTGTCSLTVTYTVNSLTSCSVTGKLCGQSVNGVC